MATAILIDGDFFLRRYRRLVGQQNNNKTATDLHWMCREHLKQPDGKRELYRIFFYDCPPLTKKAHNPLTGKAVDFSKTPTAVWRFAFHDELRRLRKVALRLGYLNEDVGHWTVNAEHGDAEAQGLLEFSVPAQRGESASDERRETNSTTRPATSAAMPATPPTTRQTSSRMTLSASAHARLSSSPNGAPFVSPGQRPGNSANPNSSSPEGA